jgi:hypothetical protein
MLRPCRLKATLFQAQEGLGRPAQTLIKLMLEPPPTDKNKPTQLDRESVQFVTRPSYPILKGKHHVIQFHNFRHRS